MMLTELSTISDAVLPVQALKDHLRLGSGFGEDGLQDALLVGHLRAALAAIEGRIGKVLLTRSFRLVLEQWRDQIEQPLPVTPVSAIASVVLVDAAAASVTVPAHSYRLIADMQRPRLAAVGSLLPTIPSDGRVEIVFEAGFAGLWAGVPADLGQAVVRLAAALYEQRQGNDPSEPGLPAAVRSLIEPWRTVRILGAGGTR